MAQCIQDSVYRMLPDAPVEFAVAAKDTLALFSIIK